MLRIPLEQFIRSAGYYNQDRNQFGGCKHILDAGRQIHAEAVHIQDNHCNIKLGVVLLRIKWSVCVCIDWYYL